MNDCIINTRDYQGKQVVFREKRFEKKRKRRPELGDASFIRRITETIQEPLFVYRDLRRDGTRRAQYIIEYESNNKVQYTKVMVDISCEPLEVITAYRPDSVKERGKTQLLYGQDPYAN